MPDRTCADFRNNSGLKSASLKKKTAFMHLIKKKSRAENELTRRTMQRRKKDTPPATAVHSRNVKVVALADVDARLKKNNNNNDNKKYS